MLAVTAFVFPYKPAFKGLYLISVSYMVLVLTTTSKTPKVLAKQIVMPF